MKPDRSSGLAHERFTRSFRDGCQELFNWAASIGLPGAKELLTLPRLVRRSGTGDYRLSLVGTNNARRALKRLIFCENGLLCSRYRTLAAELAGKHPIPAGHIHIPGAALFLETLFPDKGAAESIDNTFTIIGKRERWT